jgi:hypothetical protein
MASYFLKTLPNGLLITSEKMTSNLQLHKGIDLIKNGYTGEVEGVNLNGLTKAELERWLRLPQVKFGFFPLTSPLRFRKMRIGEELPLTITEYKCDVTDLALHYNLCWASYDGINLQHHIH